ncbi:MAG TPA: hypothetical protein VNW04_00155 [Puia sp.]|nr:hypothetical protein [Puia sp.]
MDTPSSDSFPAAYRSVMTGLFVGIADAFICLIYNIAYRSSRHYFSSTLLNVSYLIFGMLFIFFLIGLAYMVIRQFFRNGDLIFFIVFVMLTVWVLWAIHWAHFSADAIEDASLRGEYTGVAIIAGISAAAGIPLLHRSRKFELYIV